MKIFGFCLLFLALVFDAAAQSRLNRSFGLKTGGTIAVKNSFGRVIVRAEETEESKVFLIAESQKSLADNEIKTSAENGRVEISVNPNNQKTRIDLTVRIPLRSKINVETNEGEVRISGNVASANVTTDTGTISTDVPLDWLKYNFTWNSARPRYLSDQPLPSEVKEKGGGRFVLSGKLGDENKKKDTQNSDDDDSENTADDTDKNSETENSDKPDKKSKGKKQKSKNETVELNFTTERGIVLLNVDPNEVPSNLQARQLTEAAKAIVRSGDSLLTEAIRRASPKFFGDYLKTLPPRKREPVLMDKLKTEGSTATAKIRQVSVKVTDENNRAIGNLQKSDFSVSESGQEREVLSVEQSAAPFNLVLLLDVSGSVDNYVDFIRKAARNFVNTMRPDDKISIVIFNEDVKQISTFTTDRGKLSESLDTFDAGGATAYYDALAYTLVETLRPLRGERTAIVVLTDGDDNRSFLPFDSLLGSIQESGALIYPLYVPSGLVAASAANDANLSEDPLRTRYMALTSKADTEGARLAQVSGGVYYPIKRLSDLQKAYDDIAVQLRTAYTVKFRSDGADSNGDHVSPRLRIKVNRPNTFVNLGAIKTISQLKNIPQDFNFPPNENFYQNVFYSPDDFQHNDITGEIEKINYKQFVADDLREYKFADFKVNNSNSAFLLSDGQNQIAVSRWLSPKRTRSYPYERVYNTLAFPKRAAIIPVVKDEGAGGERDFLQWDTISLLNLLDVYLIPAYYSDAVKNTKRADQITEQKLDEKYINEKLKEIFAFKGSAREWNEREVKNLSAVFEKARTAYAEIYKKTQTYLHDDTALIQLIGLTANADDFAAFSRNKALRAQSRETQSIQPKEALATDTKGKVTITNLVGGKYFFTCDETLVANDSLFLIEDKHSQRAKMPSDNDIKDGLLKMIIYTNLRNVRAGKNPVVQKPVLKLTSVKMNGAINSNSSEEETTNFFEANLFDIATRNFIQKLFQEARENNFTIKLEKGETAK